MDIDLTVLVDWYKSVPEDLKKFVAFRHERIKDQEWSDLYHIFKLAERATKLLKKASRECSGGKQSKPGS